MPRPITKIYTGFVVDDLYRCICRRWSETAVKLAVPDKEYVACTVIDHHLTKSIGVYGWRVPITREYGI